MKQTLFLKYADLIGQITMLFPLLCLIAPNAHGNGIVAYFTVGGWQAVSCAVTAITGTKPCAPSRRQYSRLLAWILGIFVGCSLIFLTVSSQHSVHESVLSNMATVFGAIAWVEAAVMLFLGPVMAVWYATITAEEIRLLKEALHHRSEVHWKL